MTAKSNGVYYTPRDISDFLVQRSFNSLPKKQIISILEPSCGDGIFIESINNFLKSNPRNTCSIDCVEIDEKALKTAKSRSRKSIKKTQFLNQSFLDFYEGKRKKYDLIIGNPPYVVKKRLEEETIKKCQSLYQKSDLSEKYFRNLWGTFLVGSVSLLSDIGVLAYVLPAELLQVKFTEELRKLLIEKFDRVEVVSFKDIVFKNIEQDTILLFCYKKHSKKGLYFSDQKNTQSLIGESPLFIPKKIKAIKSVKWTCHILTDKELALLLKLKEQFKPVSYYCTAVAGIVTAANDYFVVDDNILKKYELEKYALPIIQRGIYINGSATFTKESIDYLRSNGKACNLLNFNNTNESDLSEKAKNYLKLGEDRKIDQRYKCKKRPIWYSVPGIWKSEGFFFKRSHLYPKLLTNEAGAIVTDSAYRIKMLDGNCINSLVYSFYNSLTLALAELEGRFYGGGVLELTPNEFKSVSIPYVSVDMEQFSCFVDDFKKKSSIDDIRKKLDQKILVEWYGLDASDVEILYQIKTKLTSRRLGKPRVS